MDNINADTTGWAEKLKRSTTVKLVIIGFIMLVLQLPVALIGELNRGRQNRQESVASEISDKWGGAQTVGGPVLSIPFQTVVRETERNPDGSTREVVRTVTVWQTILPDLLEIDGHAVPEVRSRGIYQAVVYHSTVKIRGRFVIPEGVRDGVAQTNSMRCAIAVSDIKGLGGVSGKLDGKACGFQAGVDRSFWFQSGMTVLLDTSVVRPGKVFDFEFDIALRGSSGWFFLPLGRTFTLNLDATWGSPGFTGAFLPVEREVTPDSFTARWQTSELNREYPQHWQDKTFTPGNDALGVALVIPASYYQQTARSIAYSILVIIIVMLSLLIAERLLAIWMHPLQYFVAGLSLVMFYALTLSVSEHAGFAVAYATAATVISAMMTAYCAAIFRRLKASLAIGAVMLAAYAVIYFILQMEDLSLLFGTLVLLVLLAFVMALTGRINRTPVARQAQ